MLSLIIVCNRILSDTSRPKNLRIFQTSDSTVAEVAWSAPENSGGRITGYHVLYSNNKLANDRKWQKQQVMGQDTTTEIKDLIEKKYFVKIKAIINGNELSPASDIIEFDPKSVTRPNPKPSDSKPKIVSISELYYPTDVKIVWQAPKYADGKIKQYEIYYTSNKINILDSNFNVKIIDKIDNFVDINDANEMKYNIYGLLPNTRYEFVIKVKTKEDNIGKYSSIVEYFTKSVTDSNPKIVGVFSGITSTDARIVWQAPKHSVGKIKRYEIYYTKNKINMENLKVNKEILDSYFVDEDLIEYINENNIYRDSMNSYMNVEIVDKIKNFDNINDVKELEFNIYGLLPNTRYEFVIKVKTSGDYNGKYSSVFQYQPFAKQSSDSTPKINNVYQEYSSDTIIVWQAPKHPVGKIKQYEVYFTDNRNDNNNIMTKINKRHKDLNVLLVESVTGYSDINNVKDMRMTIHDLKPNTRYEFIIKVKTSQDNVGKYSPIYVFVTKPTDQPFNIQYSKTSGNIGTVIIALIILIVIYFFCYSRRDFKKEDKPGFDIIQSTRQTPKIQKNPGPTRTDAFVKLESKITASIYGGNDEIERKDLKLLNIIGRGNFGRVYFGYYLGKAEVVIKVLEDGFSRTAFLEEVEMMRRCRHDKVVKMYGVSSRGSHLWIITELLSKGSLLSYLRNKSNKLKLKDVSYICAQVADGMRYLASINVVHRDLAARNILVGLNNLVKIADFGLARITNHGNIYLAPKGDKIPTKWTAPEAAQIGMYTTLSDVWSYGIMLYEVITLGKEPYSELENDQVLEEVCVNKYRMPKPRGKQCPHYYYDKMLECWDEVPSFRPSFEELYQFFENK